MHIPWRVVLGSVWILGVGACGMQTGGDPAARPKPDTTTINCMPGPVANETGVYDTTGEAPSAVCKQAEEFTAMERRVLRECVTRKGAVVIFPSEQGCATHEMYELPESYFPAVTQFVG